MLPSAAERNAEPHVPDHGQPTMSSSSSVTPKEKACQHNPLAASHSHHGP